MSRPYKSTAVEISAFTMPGISAKKTVLTEGVEHPVIEIRRAIRELAAQVEAAAVALHGDPDAA